MLIKCPGCGFSRDIHNIPADATRATCPKCGHRFMFRALPLVPDQDESRPVIEADQPARPPASPPEPGYDNFEDFYDRPEARPPEAEPGPGQAEACPWESGASGNILWRFGATVYMVLRHPAVFFTYMPKKGGYLRPFLFAVIALFIQAAFRLLWAHLSVGEEHPAAESLAISSLSLGHYILVLLVIPLAAVPILAFQTVLLHMALIIVRVPVRELETTFRLVCYANAAMVVNAIPFIGSIVSVVWEMACLAIACRYVYQGTYRQIVPAVALSAIAFFMGMLCFILVISSQPGLAI